MLGLVGFLKKKLDLEGKLPDKWKDNNPSGSFNATLNLASLSDGRIYFSKVHGLTGTDREALYCNYDLDFIGTGYGFVEVDLNPEDNQTLSLLIPNGKQTAYYAQYDALSTDFKPPFLAPICANDGGWVRLCTSADGHTAYTTPLSVNAQSSTVIPDGFYAVSIQREGNVYSTYVRMGDNDFDTKRYCKVDGRYSKIRIVANGLLASDIKLYKGNVWEDALENCELLGSAADLKFQ